MVYKDVAVNPAQNKIIVLANNTKEAKNTVQSEVFLMREVSFQEQIATLLGVG